jgi:hypothetical protein
MVDGARYQISLDSTVGTHRDVWEVVVDAAKFLKAQNPHSEIVIRDLQTGETREIAASLPLAPPPAR